MLNKNPPIIQYTIQWKSSTTCWSDFYKQYSQFIIDLFSIKSIKIQCKIQ